MMAYLLENDRNRWLATGTVLAGSSISSFGHVLGDLDKDGAEDLVFSDSDERLLEVRFGSRATGKLRFDRAPVFTARPDAMGSLSAWRITDLKDFDGDGFQEVFFGPAYLPVNGRGKLQGAKRVSDFLMTTSIFTADMNGDGFDDVAKLGEDQTEIGYHLEILYGGTEGFKAPVIGPKLNRQVVLGGGRLNSQSPFTLFASTFDKIQIFEFGISEDPQLIGSIPISGVPPSFLSLISWNGQVPASLLSGEPSFDTRPGEISLFEYPGSAGLQRKWKINTPYSSGPIRAADLEQDGYTDLIFSVPGGVQVVPGSPRGPIAYSETVDITWESVQAVAALDVEGDGVSEIVAATRSSFNRVQLLRKRGGGWFGEVLLTEPAASIITGDLNRDGYPDAVIDSSIFLNDRHGDLFLSFGLPGVWYGNADGFALADLNGDGNQDLIGSNDSIVMTSLAGPGGEFRGPRQILQKCGINIASGDLNGDGKIDLILDCDFGDTYVSFRNSDGSFRREEFLNVDNKSIALGSAYLLLDYDGDGNLDMVSNLLVENGVFLLQGTGDGKFKNAGKMEGTDGLAPLAKGDLNGDGFPDALLGTSQSSVFIYWATGGNPELPPTVVDIGPGARGVNLADLNGDQILDLVLWRDTSQGQKLWQVMPGLGDGAFAPPINVPPLNVTRINDLLADLNGDLIPDTFRDDESRDDIDVTILFGQGDFNFQEFPVLKLDRTIRLIGLEDFDENGALDLVGTLHDYLFVCRRSAEGTFEPPVSFVSVPSGRAYLVDLDGNGRKQLLMGDASSLWLFPPSPDTLVQSPMINFIPHLSSLAAGEFNGDGHMDLAAFDGVAREVVVLEHVGQGKMTIQKKITPVWLDPSKTLSFAAHDLDQDGLSDLLLLQNGQLYWYRCQGNHSFDGELLLAKGVVGSALSFPDLNLDGIDDILISGLTVFLGRGAGRFELMASYGAPDGLKSAVGDFNGDGKPDVAHGPRGGTLFYLSFGDGRGNFEAARFLTTGDSTSPWVAVGDFNGDGLPDIAAGDTDAGTPRVWYSQNDSTFSPAVDLPDPLGKIPGRRLLETADFNEDGFMDIMSTHPRGAVVTFMGGSEGLEDFGPTTYGPVSPEAMLLGNFIEDSQLDLLTAEESGLYLTKGKKIIPRFIRGDANSDGDRDLTDGIFILEFLFLGKSAPPCHNSADIDDDGQLSVTDAINLLGFLFLGSPAGFREPWVTCGSDPTADLLSCLEFSKCDE
ncbi:MAG: VCBS repeat-containing protein [Planctomycetes bacterium]|nr:VCBS repeat-containing protein [Planctomycetota bacterium]